MDEKKEKQFSRRDFLKTSGAFAGGVVGGSLFGGVLTNAYLDDEETDTQVALDSESSGSDYSQARMFFDRIDDFKTLESASELIFPEDDNGPGALALGAPIFIDKQLAMVWGVNGNDYRDGPFNLPEMLTNMDKVIHSRNNRQSIFLDGLRTMNNESKERFDKSYFEATEGEQAEIMDEFVEGNIDMKTVDSDGFFALLKQSVLEGTYSDPLYGGNKNMEGWKMRDYPGPQMSYSNWIDSEEFVQDEINPVSLIDYQQS